LATGYLLLISLGYFRSFSFWQRLGNGAAIFDRINAPANSLRSELLKCARNVPVMPVLARLGGIAKLAQPTHRSDATANQQTTAALPGDPAFAWKACVK
jgi:hypothetical protein